MSQDMVSFVLRFVREAGEEGQVRWRGIIQHVQSDAEQAFTQFSEALAFMQAHVNEAIQTSFDEAQKLNEANPFLETARLWGEYMPRYTQMMSDMMTEAMQQSSAAPGFMPPQMEQAMANAFKAWGVPTQAEQERATETLEAMLAQMNRLADQMDDLEARVAQLKGRNGHEKSGE